MTPEAQRIAIAEACGWKNCRCDDGTVNMPPKGEPDDDFNRDVVEHRNHKPYCGFPTEPHREVLPDYLSDLNAMHEAEKVLTKEQQPYYLKHLRRFQGTLFDTYHSTASQRAEAFLRTLNLWDDNK